MADTAGPEEQRSGRGRRVVAVFLSLIQPGAGHVLLGSVRRGMVWAIGMVGVGLIALAVLVVGYVGCAVDTMRLVARRPRWLVVLAGWVALVVVGSGLGGMIRSFYKDRYAQAFTIPSGSMRDTLLVGDYILVDKSIYRTQSPRRGDVVVFRYPGNERRHFIHRIVGTPGDTLQLRDAQVLINGNALDEPYVRADPRAGGQTGAAACPYAYGCEALVVPPDSYFVMGDDRGNSQDSRYWGFVRREKITGRAFVIYWSWDSDRHWLRRSRLGRPIS
jgi:signal peptidase I